MGIFYCTKSDQREFSEIMADGMYSDLEATDILTMQEPTSQAAHLVRFTRAVPAYGGGFNFRHLVTLQQDGEKITEKSHHLVIRMLEKHALLNSRRREKAWALITNAIKDALWPEKATGCTSEDQEAAFAWIASDEASQLMDSVGINHDYAMWVIAQLVGDFAEGSDDAISQALAG